jgi:DNA-binding transcriptional LysR family regulator
MPINRLLKEGKFRPEEVERLNRAFCVSPGSSRLGRPTTMFGLAKAGLAVTAMPATVMRAFNVDGVVKLPLVDPVIERELGFVVRAATIHRRPPRR